MAHNTFNTFFIRVFFYCMEYCCIPMIFNDFTQTEKHYNKAVAKCYYFVSKADAFSAITCIFYRKKNIINS